MAFLENRYVQLALLTLGMGLVFWALFWFVLLTLGLADFPLVLQLAISFLGSGLIVAKFFANRVF